MVGHSYNRVWFVLFAILVTVAGVWGQPEHVTVVPVRPVSPPPIIVPSPNIIVPQSRAIAFAPDRRQAIEITGVEVKIDILEGSATTTLEIHLRNNMNSRQEAQLLLPVPDGAVVRGFAYDGPAGQITAAVLPRDEAKRIYQQLVSQIRDPALAEFAGYNLIRSSVFPVEPRGKQRIRLTYEHLLGSDGSRIDYILPRTESLEYAVPWKITADIKSKRPIATVYSASHAMDIRRVNDREVNVRITTEAVTAPGPFRLSYLIGEDGMSASLFAYPDEKVGGGYFLLLAGLPSESSARESADAISREITLVIDRSGSMRGEKMEQAKEAALQIVSGLKEGEAFNIIVFSNGVERFASDPVRKNKETAQAAFKYIEGISAMGGTNIHDALKQALEQKPTEGMLPIVLFLTDGLPTVGRTFEVEIRELVMKSNPHKRRVFTFGVGVDVNAPLLEKIAEESRAKAEFVLPKEDVEVKVGKVFKRLSGPIITDAELRVLDGRGGAALGRTRDIMPRVLGDIFEGDQIVLLGQYVGTEPLTFEITGRGAEKPRTFRFRFEFDRSDIRNGFVPRLWASRKIAELVDAIRQMGADGKVGAKDPRVKELTDEIIRLSTEFGILTEYTAFLAREGTNLADRVQVGRAAGDELESRAMRERSGFGGVNQSYNLARQKEAKLNMRNDYYDAGMNRVSVASVQQINDRAYYRRGGQWIDSRLVQETPRPTRVVEIGTQEYLDLLERLTREGQQGAVARSEDVILKLDNEIIHVRNR